LLLGPAPAADAQPAKPTQISIKDRAEAKRLFNQAHLAFQNGDYEEAIVKWQKSYDLSKEPLIFESISSAYERLGDAKRALENLRSWRQAAPWREHKTLDSRIARLEERAKSEEADRQKRDAEAKLRREREQAERKKREDEERRKAEAMRGPSGMAILSYTLTGLGGALVVGGVVLDALAQTGRPDEATACKETSSGLFCREADKDAIVRTNTLAIVGDIGWIAGAATAVSGLVLLFTVGRSPKTEADKPSVTAVMPWFGADGAGANATFAF
jgi:tetratricopeptide (TPR) repeat protein